MLLYLSGWESFLCFILMSMNQQNQNISSLFHFTNGQELHFKEPVPSMHWVTGVNKQGLFTPVGNLQSTLDLTCMCLDCKRKWENPEETYTNTERTCKLDQTSSCTADPTSEQHT